MFSSPDVVVVTPNVLQSDIEQSVLVSVSDVDQASVRVTLEDRMKFLFEDLGKKTVSNGWCYLFVS